MFSPYKIKRSEQDINEKKKPPFKEAQFITMEFHVTIHHITKVKLIAYPLSLI